ncbi:MAG: sugar diacid recognition domain-containing protein [Anaeromyxobacteraceae bacterium]
MPLDAEFLKLTDRFLDFIRAETGFHVIACDETGTIVRATVRERIGTSHAFAKKVLEGSCDEYAVTADEAAANPLVKEGLNCPIVLNGRRVATFGIAGKLEVTRPVAHIAARVLSGWLKELHQTQALHRTAGQVFAGIDELSLRLEAGASTAQASADTTARAVQVAVAKLEQAEITLAAVHRIAQQARILSINGSIEATRAGDHGRAFGVVAKDMTRLAEETKDSSSEIQRTLAELGKAVKELQDAVQRSHDAANEQRRSVDAVNATVGALKHAVEGLEQGFDEAADGVTARPAATGTAPRAQAPRPAAPPAPRAAPRP